MLGEKRDFIAYEQNKLLRRTVERGEAINRLLDIQIENGRRNIDLRDFVIYGYIRWTIRLSGVLSVKI